MYAVEFETDITNQFIELKNFEQFMNQHVKVIVLAETAPNVASSAEIQPIEQLDFSTFRVKKFKDCDAMAYQKAMRDEWE